MKKKLLIRDLTLRDGQQSMLATRMTQKQIDRLLPLFKEANFDAMEVWGGAVPDSVMRFLNEDPWERLERIRAGLGKDIKLTALSRGRNLFGYDPYPDDVIEGFCHHAVKSGINIMRTFDALNDTDNVVSTIEFVKKHGGEVDAAICYSTDPHFSFLDHLGAILKGKPLPPKLYTVDYFVDKAKELAQYHPNMISIKDMAGLIDPLMTKKIIRGIKQQVPDIPIDLHTHCTPGYGVASSLMSMLEGVDMLDTALLNFAGGPAAPAFEVIYLFAKKLGLEISCNIGPLFRLNQELDRVRGELKLYDKAPMKPIFFDLEKETLPKEIEHKFDEAIEAGYRNDINLSLKLCQEIEAYFKMEPPNLPVQKAQIPGGMYTNMISQLEQLKLSHLFEEVLQVIPEVRFDAGLIPLVTPTSQIIGAQAVNCVINRSKGKPLYDMTTTQFRALVAGSYGKTPYPISNDFRKKIVGHEDERRYDVSMHRRPDNPTLEEFGDVKLAQSEKELLLLELFPMVATTFLKGKRKAEYEATLEEAYNEEWSKINEEHSFLISGLASNYQLDHPSLF